MLDGHIVNGYGFAVYAIAFALVANLIFMRWNPRPPKSRYRKDGRTPWVAFWNVFDTHVFTPEAIRYHRRILASTPLCLGLFALGYLLLDALW